MFGEPQKEHGWLQQLVGDWTYTAECDGPPGQPDQKMKSSGTQTYSSLGGFWLVGEGEGEMPGGGPASTRLTIGYDPAKGHYVGSWVGSMMPMMWIYEGELDAAGKVLTLKSVGPSFSGDGTFATYHDVVEVVDADTHIFHSRVQNQDGSMTEFMTAEYRRVK